MPFGDCHHWSMLHFPKAVRVRALHTKPSPLCVTARSIPWGYFTNYNDRPPHSQPFANWSRRTPIQNVLLVQKPQDARVSYALKRVIAYEFVSVMLSLGTGLIIFSLFSHVQNTYPSIKLFHEPPSALQPLPPSTSIFDPRGPSTSSSSTPPIDLVITLGGDGTILHASSLFNKGPVPPVLSFSLGTLGFLLPFRE